MRIVITNAVMSNTGDAAICLGIVDSLISNKVIDSVAEVTILDNRAASTRALYPALTIEQQPLVQSGSGVAGRVLAAIATFVAMSRHRISLSASRRWRPSSPALRAYAEADLIISTGGTYLVEHYRFWPRILEALAVSLTGTPQVYWTQSMGPFKRNSSKLLMKALSRRVSFFILRDQRSQENLREVSYAGYAKSAVCADAAFALQPPKSEPRTIACAISVRRWGRTTDGRTRVSASSYEAALISLANKFLAEPDGRTVTAVSTCQGTPSYAVDDAEYAQELFGNLAVDIVDSAFHRPEELLVILARTDLVVATRMHLAILALLAGCRVVAIAYEFKTLELFESLGLHDHVIEYKDCTQETLTAAVAKATFAPGPSLADSGLHELLQTLVPKDVLAIIDGIRRN